MKYFYLLLFSFLFSSNTFSQIERPIDVETVLQSITLNNNREVSEFDKLKTRDSLLEVLKIHYEFLSYTSKFVLALETKNKEDRVLLYKHIRNYPYYLVRLPFYSYRFFDLYVESTRKLIYEYKGDLEELNRLTIVPGASSQIVQYLKMAIESAGGKWTRGEIPVDPEMLIRGNRGEKN